MTRRVAPLPGGQSSLSSSVELELELESEPEVVEGAAEEQAEIEVADYCSGLAEGR